jgi:putative NADH-flavin reductase
LSALLQSKWFEVTVLTRPSSNSSFPTDVHVVKTAYTEAELAKVFQGQDAVVSAVGAPGFQEQKTFIDAAIKAGVQRFIPSEFSSNTLSNAVRQLVPVFEPKKQVLDYLKEKEATGLTWTGLSTGPLLDWVQLLPSEKERFLLIFYCC